MRKSRYIGRPAVRSALLSLLCWVLSAGVAFAHAFPDHADPKVGSTVPAPPSLVRIWFDSALEPVFSSIRVQNASGKVVDNKDGHVDSSNVTLLEVTVPKLPPGSYRVFWSVVARDGHRTAGDYTFTIK